MKYTLVIWLLAPFNLVASAIYFSSQGSAKDPNEWTSAGPAFAILQHPAWAPPLAGSSWVSYAITGDPEAVGYQIPENGTVVSFYKSVTVAFLPAIGSVTYRADDSAALFVNDVLVRPEAPQAGNLYRRCSDFAVGCTVETQVTVDISPFLRHGVNVIRFDVAQRNGVSFGLNYSGVIQGSIAQPGGPENPSSATPEPGTLGLVALCVVGLAGARALGAQGHCRQSRAQFLPNNRAT
ncbi:MAG: PEP-CTERM sorting domain-containing protein [Bryobacteraceae bacterium]|nr:PEP-CTERM sorting domain-containing protein [Bryobacteraceae bacterium]MDW8378253.1 PEP-CTERM sorting domain-containing protein [Bryobacterales bacterium]